MNKISNTELLSNETETSNFAKPRLGAVEIERLLKLEEKAIKFIRTVRNATDKPLFAGNSSGKDSGVVDYLLQKSGIAYFSYHTNTTIDPVGSLKFLKENYPHTQILQPNESFLQLIERKGFPTRLNRYCCEHLKEYASIGKMVFEGVRSAESKNRQGRDYIQCDSRKSQEGAQHIYPIYDWSDRDVWNYIQFREIAVNPNYEKGLDRIGCVACPLVKKKTRQKEGILFPKMMENYKRAIGRGMNKNPQWKITVASQGDENLAMEWWMSNLTMNEFFLLKGWKIIGSKKTGYKIEFINNVQQQLQL